MRIALSVWWVEHPQFVSLEEKVTEPPPQFLDHGVVVLPGRPQHELLLLLRHFPYHVEPAAEVGLFRAQNRAGHLV